MKKVPNNDLNRVFIKFSSTVDVTESVPLMTELDLISSLGGLLGLTLGLGLLQLAELLEQGLEALVLTWRETRQGEARDEGKEAAEEARGQGNQANREEEEIGLFIRSKLP